MIDYPSMTVDDLLGVVDRGMCTPNCLFAEPESECNCRCRGSWHGHSRDRADSAPPYARGPILYPVDVDTWDQAVQLMTEAGL